MEAKSSGSLTFVRDTTHVSPVGVGVDYSRFEHLYFPHVPATSGTRDEELEGPMNERILAQVLIIITTG